MQTPPSALHAAQARPGIVEFVALTALLMALTALSIDVMLPALPEIGQALAVADPNERQLVVTSYLLGFAGGQIVYGPLSDRFGRKPVLLVSLGIFAVGALASAVAGTFEALLATRVLQGLGCAGPRVVAIAVVRDLYGGRDMARVMSFVMMVFIVAPVLAPGIGQVLLFLGSWQWIFVFLFVVGAWATAWSWLRLPETRLPETREPISLGWLATTFWQIISTRQTLGYTVATALVFGALLGYINSAQQIFVDIYDAGALFPVLFGIVAAAMAAAAFLNGRLVSRLGMRWLSHMALTGFLSVSALHYALALWLGGVPPLWLFCALVWFGLFFFGIAMPNFNAMAMEPLGHVAGTASSFIGAATTAGATMLGWYIGRAFDGTVLPLTLGYLILGVMALVTAAITERGRLFRPGAR